MVLWLLSYLITVTWLLKLMCRILSGARGASCIDAAVHMLNSRTSKILCHMRLLHHLLLSATYHSFSFSTQHAPGVNNHLADALSCFHCQEFYRLVPDAQPLPTTTPPQLICSSSEEVHASSTLSYPQPLLLRGPSVCLPLVSSSG